MFFWYFEVLEDVLNFLGVCYAFWGVLLPLLTSPCGPLASAPSAPKAGIVRVKVNQQVNN